MTLWWIGNAIFLLVVVPVVVLILQSVLEPAKQIEHYADDIKRHGGQFGPHLRSLQGLNRTRDLVRQVSADVDRYARAIDRIP
jgi:hypothetical protein